VGISGLKRVQVSIQNQENKLPKDDEYFQSLSWIDATLLPPPKEWGGDLPAVLETSAASLRELARLEGVARTKTAEGRAQTVVIGCVPFALCGLLHQMDPGFLRPLAESFTGHLLVAGSALFWITAILAARKILVVNV
ncbi:MAG: type II secretion system F family protein, partial [Anaerolineae bacterium]